LHSLMIALKDIYAILLDKLELHRPFVILLFVLKLRGMRIDLVFNLLL
jgi:hypothetical protein